MTWNRVLPYILATITQRQRQKVDIVWSKDSWTHNLFRLYEMIFWRGMRWTGKGWDAIRAETTTCVYRDKDGMIRSSHTCHSWESVVAHFEVWVRGGFPRLVPARIFIPALQTSAGFPIGSGFIFFAIAFDQKSDGNVVAGTSLNVTHVCTGSNLILCSAVYVSTTATDRVTSITYNGSAGTRAKFLTNTGTGMYWYTLVAPATGSHTNALVLNSSCNASMYGVSYSGAAQTGQPDAVLSAMNTQAGTSIATALTTVANNAWHLAHTAARGGSAGNPTAGSNTIVRDNANLAFFDGVFDGNAAVTPAGSNTLNVNSTLASSLQSNDISISPFLATADSGFFHL